MILVQFSLTLLQSSNEDHSLLKFGQSHHLQIGWFCLNWSEGYDFPFVSLNFLVLLLGDVLNGDSSSRVNLQGILVLLIEE